MIVGLIITLVLACLVATFMGVCIGRADTFNRIKKESKFSDETQEEIEAWAAKQDGEMIFLWSYLLIAALLIGTLITLNIPDKYINDFRDGKRAIISESSSTKIKYKNGEIPDTITTFYGVTTKKVK